MSDIRVPDTNIVIFAGRLTHDPDLSYTQTGRARCRFSIANTRYYKDAKGERQEITTFANVSCWDKQAEWIAENVKKGRPVTIEGGLASHEYTDDSYRPAPKTIRKLEIALRKLSPLTWPEKTPERQTSDTAQPQQHSSNSKGYTQDDQEDLIF